MNNRLPILLLAVITFALPWSLAAVLAQEGGAQPGFLKGKINESTSELDQIREEIRIQNKKMNSLNSQEAEVKRSHQDILKEIELIQQLRGGMDQRDRLLAEQSSELEVSLQRSKREFEMTQEALARSFRSMYMKQREEKLAMILTAESFSGFVARVKLEAMLTRLGAGLVEQIRSDGRRIQSQQKQLLVARAEMNLSREEASLQTSRLEDLMAEQMAALRNLESERRGVKNRLLELSMNEQRLAYILDDLEQQRQETTARTQPAAGALQELAGQLEWPVHGEILRGFGRSVHPKFKTVTLNNGINIAANVGAPVAAVGKGAVEFADVLPGFGQCVILDHDSGYYTLYAHLDRVFVTKGEEIAMGQVIAEVGRPEPREPSQLYFEVRHGKTPLDPADWLRPR